jgi:drug/metabolite transporter (DMT)-like permease
VSVPAAFIGVVLIWATTPLAIKWSSEGTGFLFGVTARMLLGVLLCLLLVTLFGRGMRWHRRALLTYLVAGAGVWGAMSCVYWASQFIPSGLISVLFGLTPVVTALMAALWLGERALTPMRLLGLGLGILGLTLIFGHGLKLGPAAVLGMGGVMMSVLIHSASAVWVKRLATPLNALETTTGALLVAVPLFLLSWGVLDGELPTDIDPRTAWSILYLAIFGSALGFILYFKVLRAVQASRVALITLMTPVLSLLIGHLANGEVVGLDALVGASVLLIGLACFQWGEHWQQRLASRRT